MRQRVRVLVVDDSAFFRQRITQALQETDEIKVVGQASNGREAVELAFKLRPDVATMDVDMPVMDGISAVREIMRRRPIDVIMFSSLTNDGAKATLDALDAGAVDFISKQADPAHGDHRSSSALLRERILAVASRGASRLPKSFLPSLKRPRPEAPARHAERINDLKLILIGASTGGPVALQRVIGSLPRGFRTPVLVAVHMPAAFTPAFAERLNQQSEIEVSEASHGDPLLPGQVLVAPGGMQTLVEGRPGALRVAVSECGNQLYKPSIDLCFESAAQVAGNATLAVVMTGMGADGKEGAKLLKQRGGHLWSQDAASCVVYGMPQAVESAGLSDRVLSLDALGPALAEIQWRGPA